MLATRKMKVQGGSKMSLICNEDILIKFQTVMKVKHGSLKHTFIHAHTQLHVILSRLFICTSFSQTHPHTHTVPTHTYSTLSLKDVWFSLLFVFYSSFLQILIAHLTIYSNNQHMVFYTSFTYTHIW